MQDKKLVLALSSKERLKRVATNEIEFDHFLEETYQEWLERKPLLKEEQMEEILAYKQLSKAEFARSIAPIEEIEVPSLYKTLTEQSWYHLHREILANVQEIREEEEFNIFLRPYKKWLEEKIVIYVFASAAELFPRNQEVDKKLQLFVQELIKTDFNNISQQSWCNGLREQIKQTRKELINRLAKSCRIQGMVAAPSVDLMNGLGGVGYELLRSQNSEISNVLVLE